MSQRKERSFTINIPNSLYDFRGENLIYSGEHSITLENYKTHETKEILPGENIDKKIIEESERIKITWTTSREENQQKQIYFMKRGKYDIEAIKEFKYQDGEDEKQFISVSCLTGQHSGTITKSCKILNDGSTLTECSDCINKLEHHHWPKLPSFKYVALTF